MKQWEILQPCTNKRTSGTRISLLIIQGYRYFLSSFESHRAINYRKQRNALFHYKKIDDTQSFLNDDKILSNLYRARQCLIHQ